MTRAWMLVAGLLLFSTALPAQDVPSELKQLQGTWTGTLIHVGGKEASAEEKKLQIKLRIAGAGYQVYAEDMLLMSGSLRLDPAQKAIDAIFGDGNLKGTLQKGIYALQGDTFTVNFAQPGEERPRGLVTRDGSEESTIRYVRDKK